MKHALYAFIAVVVLIAVYRTTRTLESSPARGADVAAIIISPAAAPAGCALSAIKIKSMKAGFVDACRAKSCPFMRGVAVLANSCSEAIGVQVKMVALDASGAPVAARELWPASVSNIEPGEYTFSLDYFLDYDPRIKTFTLAPSSVKKWQQR